MEEQYEYEQYEEKKMPTDLKILSKLLQVEIDSDYPKEPVQKKTKLDTLQTPIIRPPLLITKPLPLLPDKKDKNITSISEKSSTGILSDGKDNMLDVDQAINQSSSNSSPISIIDDENDEIKICEAQCRQTKTMLMKIKPFTKQFNNMVIEGRIAPIKTLTQYAKCLLKYGYVVIPIYNGEDEINGKNKEFKDALSEMPEYKHPMPLWKGEEHYVKGGFGALGNPSSFHNPFVRQVRIEAMKKVIPIFSQVRKLSGKDGYKLEQLVDRMRVLRVKADIMAESWHRDTTPQQFTSPGDLIYGGWISFDTVTESPQLFSAFDESHVKLPMVLTEKDKEVSNSGFSKASKDQVKILDKKKEDILKQTKNNGWYIEVPSGSMLIFQQEMVHEVVGGKGSQRKQKKPSLRLFTGWRLTGTPHRFMKNQNATFFDKMSVPYLKSNQKIDMWPGRNWTPANWNGLQEWSQTTFDNLLLETKVMGSGPNAGESRKIIPRNMYSLEDISIKLQAKIMIDLFENEMDKEDIGITFSPEIYNNVITMAPEKWRTKWNNEDLVDYGIDPTDTIYPKYNQEEIDIMTPNVKWTIDGEEFKL